MDKAEGTLLCAMIGDALGAAVEGWPASRIKAIYPGGVVSFLHRKHMGMRDSHNEERYGMYTDDANSILALASSILQCHGVNAQHAADTNAEYALTPVAGVPVRAYPDSARRTMKAILNGTDISKTGRLEFPEGKFSNGGAVRIAPVALWQHGCMCSPTSAESRTGVSLRDTVESAILSTHVHPHAIDAAVVQASAIEYLLSSNATINPKGAAKFSATAAGEDMHTSASRDASSCSSNSDSKHNSNSGNSSSSSWRRVGNNNCFEPVPFLRFLISRCRSKPLKQRLESMAR